jgi:aspartyl-tRNA(Asn)/glutamyl-tRNA(Gln) amidotransferase subunit A
MKPDLSSLSLSTAFEQLSRREFTAVELTEACFHQIARLDPMINAFITPTLELAVQAAMQADVLYRLQPPNLVGLSLLGLPVAVKDLIDVAGIPTTAGSSFFAGSLPEEDAQSVLSLKLAGAVIVGKTNTHEIALGVTGVNPHYGAVKNPWDTTRISGGSSSGSAAAVATGMCLAALGTDTGGSIRIPASFCGVVGLKPTYGRVSTRGVIPLSWNLDHVGTLTRTVADAARMLSALAGFDTHDPSSVNLSAGDYSTHLEDGIANWRIGFAAGEYFEISDVEVMAAVEEAARLFGDLGAQVEKVDLPWLAPLALANGQMTQADAAAFHRQRLQEHPDWFGADVLQRLRNGAALTSNEYALARRTQVEARRRFEMFFEKYDVLLLPSTPVPAPAIESIVALEAAPQLTSFTSPFNLTGLPVLSVPCGFTQTGLPVGMQIVSKHWGEANVLQAGRAFEKATEWHNHRPTI